MSISTSPELLCSRSPCCAAGDATDDSDLHESLLGGDADAEPSSSTGAVQHHHQQQQLIHYQPFSVDTFIQWVLKSWHAFLSECSGVAAEGSYEHAHQPDRCARPLLPAGTLSTCLEALLRGAGGGGAPSLSLIQAERLEELQERLAVPYNSHDPQHSQQLAELWALGFPGTPCSLKAEQWKDMGWQVCVRLPGASLV
jgi:hypothetical protein